MFIPEYIKSTSNFDGAKLAKIVRMNDISSKHEDDVNGVLGGQLMTRPNIGFSERLFFEYIHQHMCERCRVHFVCPGSTLHLELMARRGELEVLKNYGFDAAFAEQLDFCGIGVIRYLGIQNLLWISTTPLMETVTYNLGVPTLPSYVPTVIENDNGDTMDFWHRAYNFYMYIGTIYVHRRGTDLITEVGNLI
ncbi:unnamed protein product [Strongylus vulgaris]|uniref:glucuronosyltransferase n=1 Tax=Strongylus vulgaris TaxID=40348 RepID=A0A3P7J3C2_STRVU|nr:unnamed protein product [Strongylus vulgaris]